MKKFFNGIKWLFKYMTSILMYAIIVIFVIIGIMLLAYFIDSRRSVSNREIPLYGAYVILTGSMEPIIKPNDAVVIRRVNEENLQVGDVITYRSVDPSYYGILITHRIIEINEDDKGKTYVTKGDHNVTPDRSPITANQIYGKVVMRIPKIGYLKSFLVSSYGWIIAVVVPSLGIIIYDVMKLFKKIKNSKKGKVTSLE